MTVNATKQEILEKRMITFSKKIIQFAKKYQRDPLLLPICTQLTRAATSIGANYHEANNASSKADFRNKVFIAKKETAETRYWLDVLEDQADEKIRQTLRTETQELLMILQAIVNTLKNGKNGTW